MARPTAEHAAPERQVALDMARLGVVVGPAFLAIAALGWGWAGLVSAGLAFALVVLNLLAGAWIIGRAAAISPNALMAGVLGGFLVRLIALSVIVVPLRGHDWFEVWPFALALVGGHLALLVWESRRVSMSFAYPGLPPRKATTVPPHRWRSKASR